MARKKAGVGSGKVTALQVAFIVERFLAENGYNSTLALFRSEAASLFGTGNPRQAPKSMLSLVDILDDYISLKEQKIALGQEKARIDQLLFGMQDIMHAYHSGATLPPSSSAALARPLSGPYAITSVSATPSSAAAINGPSVVPALPVANNKRKNSNPLPDASLPAKKSRVAAHQVNSPCEKSSQELQIGVNGNYQVTQVGQSASHSYNNPQICSGNAQISRGPSYSAPVPMVHNGSTSVSKSRYNQPSKVPAQGKQQPLLTTSEIASDSTCPQTPPQALCNQPDSSISPLEGSCAIHGYTSMVGSACNSESLARDQSIVCDGEETGQEIQKFETRSSKTLNSTGSNALTKDYNSAKAPSPKKLNPRKPGKKEQIRSRLDFNGSAAISSMDVDRRGSDEATSTDCISTCHAPVTCNEIDEEQFDFADIPIFDPELDKFMSDFLMDFGMDSEELGHVSTLLDQPDDLSKLLVDNQSCGNEIQTSMDFDNHLNKGVGVLTNKDMNIQAAVKVKNVTDTHNKSTSNRKGGNFRGVADQENIPML